MLAAMADFLWFLEIVAYTLILIGLLRQSYAHIFLARRQPAIWIVLVTCLAAANVLLAYWFSFPSPMVAIAIFAAAYANKTPPLPSEMAKMRPRLPPGAIEAAHGIEHARLKYWAGIASFIVCSAILCFLLLPNIFTD
jgi:hypothetical protein